MKSFGATFLRPDAFPGVNHICVMQYQIVLKDLMQSKNTSGYFSFYVDNISLKHIPLGIFQKFPLNPIK